MTIPGRGDLAPRRRYRGRGRRRGWAVLLVVAVLAAGGWLGWDRWHGSDRGVAAPPPSPCPRPTAGVLPAAAGGVVVRVLNSTARPHLAHAVAAQLRARGMRVNGVGNTRPTLARTTVRYPAGAASAALAVAEQLGGGVDEAVSTGTLTLVIGRDFGGVVPKARAAQAHARDVAAASPSPPACARR